MNMIMALPLARTLIITHACLHDYGPTPSPNLDSNSRGPNPNPNPNPAPNPPIALALRLTYTLVPTLTFTLALGGGVDVSWQRACQRPGMPGTLGYPVDLPAILIAIPPPYNPGMPGTLGYPV